MTTHIRKQVFSEFCYIILTLIAMLAYGTEPTMAWPDSIPGKMQRDAGYGSMPIFFIPNQGQFDEQVAYAIQGKDKSVFFTPEGLIFVLTEKVNTSPLREKRSLREIEPGATRQQANSKRWVVKLDFVGARRDVRPESLEQAETVISYFKGCPEDWKTGLKTSSKIIYRDLWPGIDLIYHGTVNRLKYDFIVYPGADPEQIKMSYRGADRVEVTKEGRLEVATPLGVFQDEIPKAWQEMNGQKVNVSMAYALKETHKIQVANLSFSANDSVETPGINSQYQGHVYGFTVGQYDRSRTLILDPVILIYCGYIGGEGYDEGYAIAVDISGNAYITGLTQSTESEGFPVKVGPDLTYNWVTGYKYYDAFVAKVNAAGTALVYCGYIGGLDYDVGYAIAVDSSGHAYVTGYTKSTEADGFPVKVGPDLTYNGDEGGLNSGDAFVAKVNVEGTDLVYCGYIGGSGDDAGRGIAVDSTGNAYVTGFTKSTQSTFPVKVGPDLTYNGDLDMWDGGDAFVAKVNADGTALVYCGYIGGSGDDYGYGIAVDGSGYAYVTGEASSNEFTFPVKVGPDLTVNGIWDAFVAKVKRDGTNLDYCGYIGGYLSDTGYSIALDNAGNAYITGSTGAYESTSLQTHFPVKVGPDLTHNGNVDAFVAKVNSNGTDLLYCGYIGGSGVDSGLGIAVDSIGNAYVTGNTRSYTNNTDALVAKVKADGTSLDYSLYLGGSSPEDVGNGIAVDSIGNVYVVGSTESDENSFLVKVGPDLTHNGGRDVFVAKISTTIPIVQVTPSNLNFGHVAIGSHKDLRVTIKNVGGAILAGNATAVSPFSVVAGGSYSLGIGSSCVVTVRYKPISEGPHNGTVLFTGGNGATVQVTGTTKNAGLPWLMLLLGTD